MMDKRLSDKPVQFEISMGNAGNTIDGQVQSAAIPGGGGGSGDNRRSSTSASPAKLDELETGSTTGGFDDGKKTKVSTNV